MSPEPPRVVVIPCSGIGKTYGAVAREAAYDLCEDLNPGETELVALAKLVLGDDEAEQRVRTCPVVTIDGCKLKCASKLVTHTGGTVAHEVAVLDVYRRHKQWKPSGIGELNAAGHQLARILAEEVAQVVDQLRQGGAPTGAGDV